MKSKGGKIEYFCPQCKSDAIKKRKSFGICSACNTYWPWATRLRLSIAKRAKVTA